MKKITLKPEVTPEDLQKVGFTIEKTETPSGPRAYARRNRSGEENKEVVIVLYGEGFNRPPRTLQWRFQSEDGKPMMEEIRDVLDLFDIQIPDSQKQMLKETHLNQIAKKIHQNAVDKGWWEEDRNFGEIIALIHTEVSEAFEEYRNRKPMYYEGENGKPEGIAVELIDVIIRVLDYLARENVNIDEILIAKHEYNKKRSYKHGNKAA